MSPRLGAFRICHFFSTGVGVKEGIPCGFSVPAKMAGIFSRAGPSYFDNHLEQTFGRRSEGLIDKALG